MTKKIRLEGIELAIANNKMMERWADGLWVTSEEEGLERANEKKREAIEEFEKIMSSPKAVGNLGYETWAINKVLGLNKKANMNARTKSKYRM